MLKKNTLTFLFIGHFAVDTIIRNQKENEPTLGGSVCYSSLALKTYAEDVDIKIISHIGQENFNKTLLDDLKQKGIDLSPIEFSEGRNTNFILNYHDHMRDLTLKSKSPNLELERFKELNLQKHPDAIILVPLCNEISYEYVNGIVKMYPEAYVGIDLQGFIRHIDNQGKVSLEDGEELTNTMIKIIEIVGEKLVLKGSEDEMKILSHKEDYTEILNYFKKHDGIFIMTLGENGSLITQKGKEIVKIPAYKPEQIIDETGAGDVYLSIFVYELLQHDGKWDKIEEIGNFAAVAASFLIEKCGPQGFKSKSKILDRMAKKKFM